MTVGKTLFAQVMEFVMHSGNAIFWVLIYVEVEA